MWRIVELCAKLDLPFQIHTGHARIQGSNPMLLADLIAANPKTKFILFHGGYPWIGETGAIATRYKNVWVDSVWLPTISYTMGKRAYQEWLEVMGSNRIMWRTLIMPKASMARQNSRGVVWPRHWPESRARRTAKITRSGSDGKSCARTPSRFSLRLRKTLEAQGRKDDSSLTTQSFGRPTATSKSRPA